MLREILRVCLLFTAVVQINVECSRILGIFPGPTKSHFVMFKTIMKGLAARGHEVDVVSHFPLEEPLPRYNDLSVKGSMPILLKDGMNMTAIRHIGGLRAVLTLITVTLGYEQCEIMFKHPVFKQLLYTNRTYDVVITETFGTDCMLGFGHHFNVPNIILISSVSHPWANDMFGNPDNPSYISNYYSPYYGALSFKERLMNSITYIITKLWYKFCSVIPSDRISKEFFGHKLPNLKDLASNVSLGLVNSHYSINGARPMVPNFIEVGGVHIKTPKPLSKDLEEYLSGDGRGVIYFSLGSIILAETFDHDKLQGIFDSFKELSKEYKVLWKAVKSKFPSTIRMPDNVKFIHWIPQLDVLCHPNVKVFISHGGLMGTQEGVYCGKPMIGIPMFADQKQNVNAYSNLGILKILNYEDITLESFLDTLKSILHDKSYESNAAKVSELFRNRPMTPLETSVFWIEYVAKYGSPMMTSQNIDPLRLIRSLGADLFWYQYYLLDVIALLTLLFLFITFFIKMILVTFCRCLFIKQHKDMRKKNL